MKQILSFTIAVIVLASCGSDECVTCEKQLPNSTTSSEICAAGTDVTVRSTVIGVIDDQTIKNSTVLEYQTKLEGQGYTCK
jgi:hypothetical protein